MLSKSAEVEGVRASHDRSNSCGGRERAGSSGSSEVLVSDIHMTAACSSHHEPRPVKLRSSDKSTAWYQIRRASNPDRPGKSLQLAKRVGNEQGMSPLNP